jgi:hypothetical protein
MRATASALRRPRPRRPAPSSSSTSPPRRADCASHRAPVPRRSRTHRTKTATGAWCRGTSTSASRDLPAWCRSARWANSAWCVSTCTEHWASPLGKRRERPCCPSGVAESFGPQRPRFNPSWPRLSPVIQQLQAGVCASAPRPPMLAPQATTRSTGPSPRTCRRSAAPGERPCMGSFWPPVQCGCRSTGAPGSGSRCRAGRRCSRRPGPSPR